MTGSILDIETAALTMAVAVTAEVMKGPGMIVGGTMAGDMEIMRIDTEEAIDMVLTITGMTDMVGATEMTVVTEVMKIVKDPQQNMVHADTTSFSTELTILS